MTTQPQQGTELTAPVINKSGPSHYSTSGAGGWQEVPTLARRDELPLSDPPLLHFDGQGCGQRRLGMVVVVTAGASPADWQAFQLQVAGYEALTDAQKLAALADNASWQPYAGAGAGGGSRIEVFTGTVGAPQAVSPSVVYAVAQAELWRPRYAFNAAAAPLPGPNWELLLLAGGGSGGNNETQNTLLSPSAVLPPTVDAVTEFTGFPQNLITMANHNLVEAINEVSRQAFEALGGNAALPPIELAGYGELLALRAAGSLTKGQRYSFPYFGIQLSNSLQVLRFDGVNYPIDADLATITAGVEPEILVFQAKDANDFYPAVASEMYLDDVVRVNHNLALRVKSKDVGYGYGETVFQNTADGKTRLFVRNDNQGSGWYHPTAPYSDLFDFPQKFRIAIYGDDNIEVHGLAYTVINAAAGELEVDLDTSAFVVDPARYYFEVETPSRLIGPLVVEREQVTSNVKIGWDWRWLKFTRAEWTANTPSMSYLDPNPPYPATWIGLNAPVYSHTDYYEASLDAVKTPGSEVAMSTFAGDPYTLGYRNINIGLVLYESEDNAPEATFSRNVVLRQYGELPIAEINIGDVYGENHLATSGQLQIPYMEAVSCASGYLVAVNVTGSVAFMSIYSLALVLDGLSINRVTTGTQFTSVQFRNLTSCWFASRFNATTLESDVSLCAFKSYPADYENTTFRAPQKGYVFNTNMLGATVNASYARAVLDASAKFSGHGFDSDIALLNGEPTADGPGPNTLAQLQSVADYLVLRGTSGQTNQVLLNAGDPAENGQIVGPAGAGPYVLSNKSHYLTLRRDELDSGLYVYRVEFVYTG